MGTSENTYPIRLRSVLIGLFFVILLCAITPYNNYYLQNSRIAGNHLPVGSIFVLLFLVSIVNIPLRKFAARSALASTELITIWIMLIVAVGIPSMGFLQFLLPCLTAVFYFASPDNEWAETLHTYIPKWLVVSDATAVTDFYEGIGQAESVPWGVWIKPLCIWTLFILIFYFTTFCFSIVFRKQWTERERFAFPLIQIPLELVAEPSQGAIFNSFFKTRLLWFGMLIPIIVHFINGLHSYIPSVPEIPRIFNIHRAFQDKPWYTLSWWPAVRIVIYFSVIGIAALLTLEVSFSLWFFFLIFKLQYIIMNVLGWGISPWISCSRQVMGGYLVFVPAVFWVGREHIADIFRKAFISRSRIDDSREPLSYRTAAFGFILGFVALVSLCSVAGISLWVSTIVMVAVFITSVVLSWMVVNGGLLLVQAPFFPSEYIQITAGSSVINPRSLAVLSFQRGFLRDWGEFMMPNFLHSFRSSEEVRLSYKKLFPVIMLSIVVAIIVSSYASLGLIYHKGALYLQRWVYVNAPRNYFQNISALIQYPVDTEWNQVYSMLAGGGVTFFLLWMRQRFVWWSLHPIGYLLGATYPPFQLWSSICIGWFIKYSMLKFGGVSGYRKLRPFCLGLIFGEYLMVGFWMVIGWFTQVGYFALPS